MRVSYQLRLIGWWLAIFVMTSAAPNIVDTSIACDKSDFLLKITFDDVFHGMIQSRNGDPKCIYVNGSIQADNKYHLKIPLKGCSTKKNEEGNLENEIEVINSNRFNIDSDKRFLLTCIPAAATATPPKESQVTVSFGGITINADVTTASTISDNRTVDYLVKVLDGDTLDSPQLRRPLAVGDKVTYTVEMKDELANGRIGRCWANDGMSELPLSDSQGCSLQTSGEVWGDFEVVKRNGLTIFYNHIKAWAFPTSNEVNIFCNLHICVTCNQPLCRGRERRHHHSQHATSSHHIDPFSTSVDVSDISPPIAVRTSFRLRRGTTSGGGGGSPTAKLEAQPNVAENLSNKSGESTTMTSSILLFSFIMAFSNFFSRFS